jgi:predicted extracellular nuclease
MIAIGAGAALGQTTDLIISEYVEGSGNNKALEIYNGTEDVINLGGYTIERYSNGASTATSIALDAVDLDAGEAFVIANPSAVAALLALADQTDGNINFNGNDALVLTFSGSVVIDSFGRVGEDPGSGWSCADGSTANHTLRRLSSICTGDTVINDAFDPCVEWSFAPSDVISGLGEHIADCGAVADDATTWGQLKATFR